MIEKITSYKKYVILKRRFSFGILFDVLRPGEELFSVILDSYAAAKRWINVDILQRSCGHDFETRRIRKSNLYVCMNCGEWLAISGVDIDGQAAS